MTVLFAVPVLADEPVFCEHETNTLLVCLVTENQLPFLDTVHDGTLVVTFIVAEVVDAVVSRSGQNAVIAITMKNGKTEIYKSNGQLMRKV